MGVEGFKKEYVCDMGIDIDVIADYFGKKLGSSKARVRSTTDFSKMAEMKLKKDKVGWYIMMHEGQDRLKEWVDKIVTSGQLGLLGMLHLTYWRSWSWGGATWTSEATTQKMTTLGGFKWRCELHAHLFV